MTYVGHPLLDGLEPERDRATFAREAGLDAAAPYLALLPGSRAQEVERLAGPLLDAFRRCGASARGARGRGRGFAGAAGRGSRRR